MDAVPLWEVSDIADRADAIAEYLAAELQVIADDVDVQHIGATSVRRGGTKGDVDIAVRVPDSAFASVVASCADALQWRSRTIGRRHMRASPMTVGIFPSVCGIEIRCYMRDPDGHLIEVGQLLRPTAN